MVLNRLGSTEEDESSDPFFRLLLPIRSSELYFEAAVLLVVAAVAEL